MFMVIFHSYVTNYLDLVGLCENAFSLKWPIPLGTMTMMINHQIWIYPIVDYKPISICSFLSKNLDRHEYDHSCGTATIFLYVYPKGLQVQPKSVSKSGTSWVSLWLFRTYYMQGILL